jgi:hypothetical protein
MPQHNTAVTIERTFSEKTHSRGSFPHPTQKDFTPPVTAQLSLI